MRGEDRRSDRHRPHPRYRPGGHRLTVLVVIPARWHSTRFPGKPLADIAGQTLLGRVIHQARRSIEGVADARLIVATDDERVADHARAKGCAAVLTAAAISTGSGRALAAAHAASARPQFVVNLQGDAPFFDPRCIAKVVHVLRTRPVDCATPVVRLDWNSLDALRDHKAAEPFSGTTCIRDDDGRAVWFSKAIIPAIRDEPRRRREDPLSPVYRHVGIYGFPLDALARFEAAPPSFHEENEGLEQLRLLALGMTVQTVVVPASPIAVSGIDTPHDAATAAALIARLGDPTPEMGRFFIVRHGNTFDTGEVARRIGARTDLALTAAGRRQGDDLGRWFNSDGVVFARALCGPLTRSRTTAALILAAQPDAPPATVAPWLDEIDHGPDEGREERDVVARIGYDALARWDRDAVAPPDWVVDRDRRIAAWQALFDNREAGDVLLVTSNGAARFALVASGADMPASLKLRTGATGIIRRERSGSLRVHAWDVRPPPPES